MLHHKLKTSFHKNRCINMAQFLLEGLYPATLKTYIWQAIPSWNDTVYKKLFKYKFISSVNMQLISVTPRACIISEVQYISK